MVMHGTIILMKLAVAKDTVGVKMALATCVIIIRHFAFHGHFGIKRESHIKDRKFALTSHEGNHGEDLKELYYYLDAAPSHSYLKMLHTYPHNEFPYEILKKQNGLRTIYEPEFELQDTQIFNDNNYFDIVIEYAKISTEGILIKAAI